MGESKFKIVVAEPYSDQALARLGEAGSVHVLPDTSPDTLISALEDAHALLIRAKAHVTARVLRSAPHLKVIGRASPQIDHIDLRAAGRQSVRVVYSPQAAVNSCVEHAMALLFALRRRIAHYDHQIRNGKYDALRTPSEYSISAMTVGILGVDPVGDRVGRNLADGFGCRVLYHDPADAKPELLSGNSVDLETLLRASDVVCVFVKSHPSTRGLIDADRLALMRPTAHLVNLSRGVVDTTAVAQALSTGRLAGAALDAFDSNPLATNHPIRSAPNCILTPNIAGVTIDAIEDRFNVADDVVRVLLGDHPQHEYKVPVAT